MARHAHDITLKKNQQLVHDVLSSSKNAMSAYSILDLLREKGFRAPLQVYRALDRLMELGLVHKLESLNAFIACSHDACESNQTAAFIICETCKKVSELNDPSLASFLGELASKQDFDISQSTIELRGHCASCR